MEQEIEFLNQKVKQLSQQLYDLEEFLYSLSNDILDKCLKECIKALRAFSRSKDSSMLALLGDSSGLTFFDQLCIIYCRGDEQNYFGLNVYIDEVCDNAIDSLSYDEKYVFNYDFSGKYNRSLDIVLRNNLTSYLGEYSNKRIRFFLDDF